MEEKELAQDGIEDRLGAAILGSEGAPPEDDDKPLSADFEPEPQEEAEVEEAEEDAEPEQELAQEDEEPEFVEVEINGTVYEVPKELEQGFLFQKDYTQKTQTLADQRREVELQQKQVEQIQKEQTFIGEVQPDLNNIAYLNAQIEQMSEDLKNNISNLTSEEMFKKKIELDGLKDQSTALQQSLQMKYKEFEEAQQDSYRELLEQGAQVLKQSIPDWNEEKQTQVRDYALGEGLTQQEVASIIDPRHVKILWKAAQYDSLQQNVKGAKAKVKEAPTIRPKSRSAMTDATKQKISNTKRLKGAKTSRAKAEVLVDILGERMSK
jgi:hypothetical protein